MSIARPELDLFYAPVRTVEYPGELLRRRPVALKTQTPCSASQVVYGSTGTHGQDIAVSGTLLQPTAPWLGPGPRPILSYGVGLHGLCRDLAPSYLMRIGKEVEMPLIEAALSRGWTVAITDGDGLGLPGPHTYLAGRPGGHAMLDIVRVALHGRLPRTVGSPVLLWGYSEGGRYAAWAAELHPTYAPELNLIAVAAGGVPADLYEMAQRIDGGPFSGLGLAVYVGLKHAYGNDPALAWVFNRYGRAAAEHAATLDAQRIISEHPEAMHRYTRRAPWDEPIWRRILDRERNGQRRPAAPIYLYHAKDDQLVPIDLAHTLHADYAALDGDVTWKTVHGDHLAGAFHGAPNALEWLTYRTGRQVRGIPSSSTA